MPYEPNLTHWPRGSYVLHSGDAKQPRSLMKIIGYTRDGLAKCKYVSKRKPRQIYINEIQHLHDPNQFGVNERFGDYSQEALERTQDEWERVQMWNVMYKPGQLVLTTSADGGFKAKTIKRAYLDKGGCAWVWLEPGGMWSLQHVAPIKD